MGIDSKIYVGDLASKIETSLNLESYNNVVVRTGQNDEDGNEIVFSTHDNWESCKSYSLNAFAVHKTLLYKCISAHRSGASFDESKWEKQPGVQLEIEFPWAATTGNNNIANDILAAVSGKTYQPYSMDDAMLDPAFEIGDVVQSKGIFSPILGFREEYHSLYSSDIEAPGENETEHEYKYENSSDSPIERNIKSVYTTLKVQNGLIQAEIGSSKINAHYYNTATQPTDPELWDVWKDISTNPPTWKLWNGLYWEGISEQEGLDKTKFTRLYLTQNGVFIENEFGQTEINGSTIRTGTILASTINLQGGWTWEQFNSDVHVWKTGVEGDIEDIEGDIEDIQSNMYDDSDIRRYLKRAAGITSTTAAESFIASPHILGGEIYGSKIYAGSGGEDIEAWMPGTDYVVGNRVFYSGSFYQCRTAHKSGDTFDSSKWNSATIDNGCHFSITAEGLKMYANTNSGGESDPGNLEIRYSGSNNATHPLILFGVGTGTSGTRGMVKKYNTGIWIGDNSGESSNSPTGHGVYDDFSEGTFTLYDRLVLDSDSYGNALPAVAGRPDGEIFFLITDQN